MCVYADVSLLQSKSTSGKIHGLTFYILNTEIIIELLPIILYFLKALTTEIPQHFIKMHFSQLPQEATRWSVEVKLVVSRARNIRGNRVILTLISTDGKKVIRIKYSVFPIMLFMSWLMPQVRSMTYINHI